MHFVLENVFWDLYISALRFADHLLTFVLDRLEVASSREPVSNCELGGVPLGFIFLVLFILRFFRTFLQNILNILEDNKIDRSVVNLAEFARSLSIQVNDQAATEVVLYLHHVARHNALSASHKLLRELA